jgi:hypothetical protein
LQFVESERKEGLEASANDAQNLTRKSIEVFYILILMFRFLEMYNESMLIIMQVELALLLEHNLQEISSNA